MFSEYDLDKFNSLARKGIGGAIDRLKDRNLEPLHRTKIQANAFKVEKGYVE